MGGVVVFLRVELGDLDRAQNAREAVGDRVHLGRFVARAGNDQRRARFIDQDRVHFVDDREVVAALDLVFLVNDHVVAQVIEAELVVRAVRDVGGVRFVARGVVLVVGNQADGKPQETVNLPHPLAVAAGQVIVDRHDVDTLAGKAV